MPSDAVPGRVPDPEPRSDTAPEAYCQRAVLLADLGRYGEAAEELAAGLAGAPNDGDLLTTLARVHLAADQPIEALAAADRAVSAASGVSGPLVARAMALTDVRRFGEAAQIAHDLLRRWPDDPRLQRTAAAILSETRNGQHALNAAWRAVALAPTEPEAHLILAMVAARLRLFDLAQRAYGEALELDPTLDEAQRDVGVIRLERRRWARALEQLADAEVLPVQVAPEPVPEVSRPERAVLDGAEETAADTLARMVRYTAASTLVIALLTALMATANEGVSRAWAAVFGVVGIVVVGWWFARLPTRVLGRLWRVRRRLALAVYATLMAPLFVVAYAAVGGPWPVVAAVALSAAAELAAVTRRRW